MAIQVKLINTQHQFSTLSLADGSSLIVKSGDTVKLLSRDNFQAVRKGNDLIIKNAKGEQFVLRDYYINARNVDEDQLFSLKEELGETKAMFSADLSDQVKLAELDTATVSDAIPAGQVGDHSAATSGGGAAGAGGVSNGAVMAGFGVLAVGGLAVASSGSGGSSNSSGVVDESASPVAPADKLLLGNLISGTDGNDRFDGTAEIDYIYGLAGDDVFNNSPGRDILTGGAGRDTFNFQLEFIEDDGIAILGFDPGSIDTIEDFVSGEDKIGFRDNFILSSPSIVLADGNLVQGPGGVALDANDYFIFDSLSGALYYDADGNGSGAAQQFATLHGVTHLAASDIILYASDVIIYS